MKTSRLLWPALAFAAMVAAAPVGSATLTFDGAICSGPGNICFNGSSILQSYGDIPGILDVSHRTVTALGSTATQVTTLQWWGTGYGDLANVAFGSPDGGVGGELRFVGLNGTMVTLTGIDLGGFITNASTAVRIYDVSGTELYSSGAIGSITADGAGAHHTETFSVTGPTLILQWHDPWDVAIDNVNFNLSIAAIPEPSTYALMLAGLGLVGFMARRRTKPPAAV
jgi:hypothetical protein